MNSLCITRYDPLAWAINYEFLGEARPGTVILNHKEMSRANESIHAC